MHSKQKVIVGISGGVDSAVSALLLKQQGFDVHGLFMRNWSLDNEDPYCQAEQDLSDARAVCDKIGIALETISFAEEYWGQVFQHCLDEFAKGRTPNPDVLCNREIKFKALLDYALAQGADFLATGHYARRAGTVSCQLLKGLDSNKDQSYFLYMLNQKALQHSLFPVGELEKPRVRKIAEQAGLINFAKKDSTGICFVGERRFKQFLAEFILAQPGEMRTPEGKYVGRHDGIMFYTIGQRKGLQIGGLKDSSEEPWYVVDKDVKNNILMVAQGEDHPLLFKEKLIATDLTWIAKHPPAKNEFSCSAKTRYRQEDQACVIKFHNTETIECIFEKPQRAVTPGQSVVFYDRDVCLGGGIIC